MLVLCSDDSLGGKAENIPIETTERSISPAPSVRTAIRGSIRLLECFAIMDGPLDLLKSEAVMRRMADLVVEQSI